MNYNEFGNTGWYSQNSDWNYTPATFGDTETPGGYTPFDWKEYSSNPEFLKLIGYEGSPLLSSNTGDSGGNQGDYMLSPDFLEKANQFELRKMTGENWNGSLSSIFKNGKEVSPSLRQFYGYNDPQWNIAEALVASAIMPGGWAVGGPSTGIGGGLGLTGSAAMGANAAFNTAILAGGSGAEDRDIGKAMLTSAGSAFLPNMGQYIGIDNPELQKAFNGMVSGAAGASINDGDVGVGAITGAIPGLASYAGGRFMNTSYVPTSTGQSLINETNQASMLPKSGFGTAPQMSQVPSYVAPNSPMAYTNSRSSSGFEMPELSEFFGKLTPSSPEGWGNLAQGLAGMFMGGMQYRKNRQLEKQFGANRDSYQTNLRRQLQRRDAASGRRSNYSGRETQLAAALAELDSRNMPAISSLQSNQLRGLADMFQSGLRYAGKQGVFGDLTPRDNLPVSSFLPSLAPMPQSSNVYDTSWMSGNGLGDGYLSRRNRLGGM